MTAATARASKEFCYSKRRQHAGGAGTWSVLSRLAEAAEETDSLYGELTELADLAAARRSGAPVLETPGESEYLRRLEEEELDRHCASGASLLEGHP